jgi:hypothetical protein
VRRRWRGKAEPRAPPRRAPRARTRHVSALGTGRLHLDLLTRDSCPPASASSLRLDLDIQLAQYCCLRRALPALQAACQRGRAKCSPRAMLRAACAGPGAARALLRSRCADAAPGSALSCVAARTHASVQRHSDWQQQQRVCLLFISQASHPWPHRGPGVSALCRGGDADSGPPAKHLLSLFPRNDTFGRSLRCADACRGALRRARMRCFGERPMRPWDAAPAPERATRRSG